MFKACVSKKTDKVVPSAAVKMVVVEPSSVQKTSQCSCHEQKGLPGWCGVAGGGVPACDH